MRFVGRVNPMHCTEEIAEDMGYYDGRAGVTKNPPANPKFAKIYHRAYAMGYSVREQEDLILAREGVTRHAN